MVEIRQLQCCLKVVLNVAAASNWTPIIKLFLYGKWEKIILWSSSLKWPSPASEQVE